MAATSATKNSVGVSSFAVRLALGTSVLLIVACTLLSWVLVRHDLIEMRRSLMQRGETISQYVAHEAELSMLSGDKGALEQIASAAVQRHQLVYVEFVDTAGKFLAGSGSPGGTMEPTGTASPLAEDSTGVWRFSDPVMITDSRHFPEEIGFDLDSMPAAPRTSVGKVSVGVSTEPLTELRQRVFVTALVATGLVTLVGILGAFMMARVITRPLNTLASAAYAMTHGAMIVTVPVETEDEVGSLAHAFNGMVQSLARNRTHLEEYSRKLERHVSELEELKRQLEDANGMKSEFLATVSHELRTPLNIIIGYAQMLREEAGGPVTGDQSEMLKAIESYSKTQLDLVTSVLDFSRLSSGKVSVQIERFDLRALLQRVEQPFKSDSRSPVELSTSVAVGVPQIESDQIKLQQIIHNLVDNAMKFTVEGSVSVSAEAQPGAVVLTVADTGPGIPPDKLPHIFEAFRQVGVDTSRSVMGVGLGLSIVKQLVDVLGGMVEVDSVVGEGTRFRVSLPLVYAGALSAESEPTHPVELGEMMSRSVAA